MKVGKNARVAFQGERGAFSEEAAVKLLGEEIALVPRPTFEAAFSAIDDGLADYILAPIENSLAGSVHRSFDLLVDSRLNILAEVVIPIAHNLIAAPGAKFEELAVVESHPVALAQCEQFFIANPRLKRVVDGGHRGQRARRGSRGRSHARGDCRPARRGNLRRRNLARASRGQQRELHAILAAFGLARCGRKCGQAFAGVSARSPAWRALSRARAVCAAESQSDEDREPARARKPVAIPVLSGPAGVEARSGSRRGARRTGKSGRGSADSGIVRFRIAIGRAQNLSNLRGLENDFQHAGRSKR